MKICAISDLHGNLIDINPADVLFICGDIVPLYIQHNIPDSITWIKEVFIPWCEEQPVNQIYLIAGNHDFAFENRDLEINKLFLGTKVIYLNNQYAEYLDTETGKIYTIWGSPLCHMFGRGWVFMYEPEYEKEQFEKMPKDCDIVITHDAPYGTSDICFESWRDNTKHIGNVELAEVVKEKQPKLLLHGHLHSSNHECEMLGDTKVYNVSIVDERYEIKYKPLEIEL